MSSPQKKSSEKYFNSLNYSLGNEDTRLEVQLCEELRPKNIFSIAGCGSRCLPLLSCYPENLVCADISDDQLHLGRLRLETLRNFSHQDFLIFWGFPPYSEYDYTKRRRELFKSLQDQLDSKTFNTFDFLFSANNWNSLLYEGKWEKTFKIFSKFLRLVMGKRYDEIFNYHSIEDQKKYFQTHFPIKKWKFILFVLGNKSVFNALLYKGHFIEKNVKESHFDYYNKAFTQLFNHTLVRESYFLHLCFHGKISHSDGNPIEAQEENFLKVKEALKKSQVYFVEQNLLRLEEYIIEGHNAPLKYDFLSLSDVPSYFKGDDEKNFMQKLRPSLNDGAYIVLRSYLRVPNCDLEGFTEVTQEFDKLIQNERFQMYRIQIFKYSETK